MGYELNRFVGEIDEELICTICSGVFENPVQAPMCEHIFCRRCIEKWMMEQNTCPVDRNIIFSSDLKPAPRLLRTLLSRLNIRCEFYEQGCPMVLKVDNNIYFHTATCDYDPSNPMLCPGGCKLMILRGDLQTHDCIRDLTTCIQKFKDKISEFENEYTSNEITMSDYQTEIDQIKMYLEAMKTRNPRLREIAERIVNFGPTLTRITLECRCCLNLAITQQEIRQEVVLEEQQRDIQGELRAEVEANIREWQVREVQRLAREAEQDEESEEDSDEEESSEEQVDEQEEEPDEGQLQNRRPGSVCFQEGSPVAVTDDFAYIIENYKLKLYRKYLFL